MAVYERFSIGCWVDPDSVAGPDGDAYFGDRPAMEAEAKRLLRAGHFKLVVLYEWDNSQNDWVDTDEWTLADTEE